MQSLVTIFGAGRLGRAAASLLSGSRLLGGAKGAAHLVDFTSIRQTEIAAAGTRIAVMVATAHGQWGEAYEALIADSVARAARGCGAHRIILLAEGDADPREAQLRASGVPLTTIRASPENQLARLMASLEADPPAQTAVVPAPLGLRSNRIRPTTNFLPTQLDARGLAEAYLDWLTNRTRGVSVVRQTERVSIRLASVEVLCLRNAAGEAEADTFPYEVVRSADGSAPWARLEFRTLLDGSAAVCALCATPGHQFPLRLANSLVHERAMRSFAAHLRAATVPSAAHAS